MSTGFWTVDRGTLRMGEPDAAHRQWLPYHPVSLCGVGDALPAQAHGCVCLLSPDTVQSRGLVKASCDRPHLHLTSVHSNESVSEIVDVQCDDRIAGLAGWLSCLDWLVVLVSNTKQECCKCSFLGHGRGAGSPHWLGHCAETSAVSSSQSARRLITPCARRSARLLRWHLRGQSPTSLVGMSPPPWTLTSECLCARSPAPGTTSGTLCGIRALTLLAFAASHCTTSPS